jgi:serine/threonine-protein kinase
MENGDPQTIGRYRRLAELGRGGMATVYLAAARGPQGFTKLVVLKELIPDLPQHGEFRTMFLDEARLAARLNHPNVVQTYEVGEDNGRHVIVMEYLEGQPLSRARKALPRPLVYFALSNVLSGLEHAHDLLDFEGKPLRVVHRDVSPHNIFVTYSGEVKLCDFGIAKAADSSAVTATGNLKGKLSYMAPEQARGEEVDARADLFAVGVILWETATGRRLWQNLQDVQILAQLLAGSIPSPRSVDPSVPEGLDRICMRALAYDRNQRYRSAADMQGDLDAFIASLGLSPTRRALGEAVGRAFAEDRAHLKTVVEEQLRNAALLTTGEQPAVRYAPQSIPSSPSALPYVPSGHFVADSGSRSAPMSLEAGMTGGRTGTGAVHSITPTPSSGRAAWMFGAALVLVAIAAVAFVIRPRVTRSDASTSGLTPPGSLDSGATATPIAATAEAPRMTKLSVRITPPGATVFLDGEAQTLGPDGALERPAGETHKLRVEAAGFAPDERTLTFDAERVVDVRLARGKATTAAKPVVSAHPATGTKPPADPSDVLGY